MEKICFRQPVPIQASVSKIENRSLCFWEKNIPVLFAFHDLKKAGRRFQCPVAAVRHAWMNII